MGYTHYWSFDSPTSPARATERRYHLALKACSQLIREWSLRHGGLAGFTAHTEPGTYGGLTVNGSRDDAAEDFSMREHYKQNESSGFCKTYRAPYDTVVVASLCILQHYLGRCFRVGSDGGPADWLDGLALARQHVPASTGQLLLPAGIQPRKSHLWLVSQTS